MEELTQQQIAARFRLSRPKVSRLLKQAKESGIVRISLVPPTGGMEAEEQRLEKKYGLDEAVVVFVSDAENPRTITRELGYAAAEAFTRSLNGNETIGLAWGSTLLGMVEALPPHNLPHVTLVQMIGGLGREGSDEHSAELVRRTAQKLNARFRLISAPGIVSSAATQKALVSDTQIAETLHLAQQADVAYVGLGILSPESVLLQRGELLSKSDQQLLQQAGAVGDVILRFLDAEGNPLKLEINKRIVGLTLEELKKIPRVVGIAGGQAKIHILRAALKAEILDVLITDHVTAGEL